MEEKDNHSVDMLSVKSLEAVFGIGLPGVRKYLKDNGIATERYGRSSYVHPHKVREAIRLRGLGYGSQTVTFQMLKGGVGKTTLAYFLGIRAHMYGARVLFVDLDGQANLTTACGQPGEVGGFIELLEDTAHINDITVQLKRGLHLVPSSLDNADLEKSATKRTRNVAEIVRMHLRPVRDLYDLIIIDTAPSLTTINAAAACAADSVVIPVNADKFSVYGLQKTIADLEGVKNDFGERFDITVAFNRLDSREKTGKAIFEQLRTAMPGSMRKTHIRACTELKNRIISDENLFSYRSTASEDFDAFTREILGWL